MSLPLLSRVAGCLLLVAALSGCQAQQPPPAGKLRLLTYGLPNFELQNPLNVVTHRWGFEYYPVAGCIVSQELIDSVEVHNAQVKALMVARHGADWAERFNADVEAEAAMQRRVHALVDADPRVMATRAELDSTDRHAYPYLWPLGEGNVYRVELEGTELRGERYEPVVYLELLVDLTTNTVRPHTVSK